MHYCEKIQRRAYSRKRFKKNEDFSPYLQYKADRANRGSRLGKLAFLELKPGTKRYYQELCHPTGRMMPDWMLNPALLPRIPVHRLAELARAA